MRVSRRMRLVPWAVFLTLLSTSALAVGTPSGTIVSNVASLRYAQGGASLQITSNPSSFRVDEILNVVVHKSDADNVVVASPDTRRVLRFMVTNTGNGAQKFQLSSTDALAGDQFDPVFVKLVIDTNGNGVYDPGVDQDYASGQNDPLIAPDQSLAIFVICDIPAGRVNNDLGLAALNVQAVIGTGAPGTTIVGKGGGGSDVVIGLSRGIANAQNGYRVTQVQPVLTKSQTVISPSGGSVALPGSIVTYTLRLELKGSGTTINSLIADAIPANGTYVAGSLRLNGTALTDQADADAGRFTGNAIEVSLGSLIAPVTHVVSFQVRLN